MVAYVGGDALAFSRLFARVAPAVRAFFVRAFADRAVADDLLQTTFLKLHRARATYRPGSPLRPWLFTIAGRVRLDELRRRYRLPPHVGEEEIEAAEAANPAPTVEAEACERDLGEVVRAAIDRLPASQRVVIHLHRYEQLSFADVARALGTTEGAVKLRAFRAYERLRRELAPLIKEDAA